MPTGSRGATLALGLGRVVSSEEHDAGDGRRGACGEPELIFKGCTLSGRPDLSMLVDEMEVIQASGARLQLTGINRCVYVSNISATSILINYTYPSL